ncbi:MAG: NAD(P)/FAD-dependent oxidoreductase [Cyclobacteriaceae bacterium]
MRNVIIIGGGLAGLISSIQLIRAGIPCTVIEKKSYPLHRVCGEYISNEAVPFLKAAGLYPIGMDLPQIKNLEFSAINGQSSNLALDLGGFGISRYAFDYFLYQIAKKEGVHFQLNTEVTKVDFGNNEFDLRTNTGELNSEVVIGSFGKRSKIDIQQNRDFIKKRSPYVAVKYHIRSDHPKEVISLHNFPGGYCGIGNVEGGITNLCYLTHRDNVKRFGDIPEMEIEVLYKNPRLKNIFLNSHFLFPKPEVINEISFETKGPVENHILMAGDAAGMITPVCGNGMAIAIQSAKILSELVILYSRQKINRETLELRYKTVWNMQFRKRLWYGRQVQRLFGNVSLSNAAVNIALFSKPLAHFIVSKTHGESF